MTVLSTDLANFAPNLRYTVRTMSKSEMGGCDRASIRAVGQDADLAQIQSLVNRLGKPVTIFDDIGQPVWWGYVNEVVLNNRAVSFGVSLDGMYNRIAVAYGDYTNDRATTGWLDDAASQLTFGKKELLATLSNASQATAEAMRANELARLAIPQGVASFDRNNDDLPSATVNCLGWWHCLDWRYYANPNGLHGHSAGSGAQAFGEGSDINRVGQVLVTLPGTVPYTALTLPLRKNNAPTDGVIAEIYTGSSLGAGTLLASATYPAAELSSTDVTNITKPLTAPVAAGQDVNIVLRRTTGIIDTTHFYFVGIDSDGGYAGGSFLIRIGGTWQGGFPTTGSLHFQLSGEQTATAQIKYAVENYRPSAAHIQAVDIETESDFSSVPFRDGDAKLLDSLNELMDSSRSTFYTYLAEVTVDRRLRIYRDSGRRQYAIGADGNLINQYGGPVRPWEMPVGHVVALRDVFPSLEGSVNFASSTKVIVARAEYTANYARDGRVSSQIMRFTPRGARDPFQLGALQKG